MTREELIDILQIKQFNCIDDMTTYFGKCGFKYNVETVELDSIVVDFNNDTEQLHFVSIFHPWLNKWKVLVYDLDNSPDKAEVIEIKK